ncbi:MAG: hypothetical protein RLZZ69_3659, partial [Cyanobacteriota bacterium]
MTTITVADNSEREILSSFKDLISSMPSDAKNRLKKRF